ncbi:MAG TPA: ADOP family duplicated permease [Vicinamibacterales bacterium]|nr:ADOP family duplicated permease [Vicinamibacterales bacterium]
MRAARAWLRRLAASLWPRAQHEADLQAEIDSHIQLHIDDAVRAGLTEAEARRQAAITFGSVEAIKEDYRDRRGLPSIDSLLQDVRYGLRTLARQPGFSVIALLVLALGIGVTTAIFSIVYAVYLRPLPVHAPEQLVYIYAYSTSTRRPPGVLYGLMYDRLAAEGRAFSAVTAHFPSTRPVEVDGAFESTAIEAVRGNYFDVLGVGALHGRVLTLEDDDYANPDNAAVVSHRLWMRRFGGDPGIVGREIFVGERALTIVGVLPRGFNGISDPWKPTDLYATQAQLSGPPPRGSTYATYPIARLRPGVTLERARSIVASHDEELARSYTRESRMRHLVLPASDVRMPFDPMGKIVSARMSGAILALIAVVLAIAAANVAGMLMARGVGRRAEIGVRMAIGAGAPRIARQLLTEGLLLALAGGLAGWFTGWTLLEVFRAYTPNQFALDVALSTPIFLFTAGVCVVVGLMVGAGPALQASRVDVLSALGGGAQAVTRRTRLRFRYGIVVPQVALSLVLLLVAGVYLKDLLRIERTDLGFSKHGSLVVQFWLKGPPPGMAPTTDQRLIAERHAERTRNFYRNVTQRFATMPELAGAALSTSLPTNYNSWRAFTVLTQDGRVGHKRASDRAFVSPGYFDVMGIRVLSGRAFDERDTMTSPKVAIVSAKLAQLLWSDGNAVGRFLAFDNSAQERTQWLEIVGVVNDVAPVLQDLGDNPFIYLPLAQQWRMSASLVLARPGSNQTAAIDAIRTAVEGADLGASITRVRTMEQAVGEILYPRRLAAAILTACSLVGLILACIGLYGVVAYSMAQRLREIGIRAALGAGRADIVRLVLGEALVVLTAGSIAGFVLARLAMPAVSNLVIPVPGPDALMLAGVPVLLAGVVLAACVLPARRASRVDPVDVLRSL